ncbi:amidase domain-containing protein [Paenibacillus sp. FSL R7-0345]|uniref:amidase domain-containing protein n=1 Tax=Paenibacillus sp. FSL R7-0345 TaxID=2954535 RepID=UPI00315A59CD
MKIKYAIGSAVLLSSILLCSAGAGMASAENVLSTESIMTQSTLSKISPIKTTNMIVIDNKKVLLYPTFQNQQSAIDGINKEAAELLNTLSQRFALGELTTDNWLDYRSSADQYATENSSMSEQETVQYSLLNRFFDIYENQDKNNAITELVTRNNFAKAAIDNSELELLLPYTSDISSNFNNMQVAQKQLATVSSIPNQSSSISYASNYAVTPNSTAYAVFGSDCTNFASQILEAGGVSQSVFTDASKGWWHKITVTQYGQLIHTNSTSWSVADTFARYMGVGYTSKSHSSFSSAIAAGDFIAADFEGDGDWNHIGFVTSKSSSSGSYGGKTYYDYKVAQHTNNYHAWTSSSTNGWETIEDDNGTYGRVRR